MRFRWEAVAARARGLAGGLLNDETLRSLTAVDHRSALVELVQSSPYGAAFRQVANDPAMIDTSVLRTVAERLRTLIRWMRPREDLLSAVFLPMDTHAIRGIVRGIAGGIPPEDRIAEAFPTPSLDRRALRILSQSDSVARVAATLNAWEHPVAPGLVVPGAGRPGIFAVEAALGRALGDAMSQGARRGDEVLRLYAAEEIDAWNLTAALVLAGARPEGDVGELFLEGGSALPREVFTEAASASGRQRCVAILSRATRRTVFDGVMDESNDAIATRVGDRIVDARIERLTGTVRRQPLSSAPVLAFVLRLRRESRVVRRAVWRTSLPTRRRS